MSLVQNLTQFAPTPGLGQVVKGVQPATFAARLNPSSGTATFYVGYPLKLVANNNTAEIIVDLANLPGGDTFFAVIPANTKTNKYAPADAVDVFAEGNTLLLEATAAINAGQYVTIGATTATGGGPGVTAVTTVGAQFGGIALNSVAAGQTAVLIRLKSGVVPQITAWTAGTYTVTAGAATVSQTKVTANSLILITLKTVGGTVAAQYVATITPGTGFTVAGGGSDTSTYNYVVIN